MATLSNGPSTHNVLRGLLLSGCLLAFGSGCSVQQTGNASADETAAERSGVSEDLSKPQITPEDIHLAGVRLGSSDGGKTFQVAGQIRNNSPGYTLTELRLKVVMQDCLDSGVCEILAEDVADVMTEVPAGEERDFQVDADFGDMRKPKGMLGWHYAVVDAKGIMP